MTMRAATYAEMALHFHGQPDLDHTLERVAEYARDTTASDDASVMLLNGRGDGRATVATDSRVAEADRLQSELGEGPSIRPPHDSEPLIVDDVITDERWPAWDEAVAALGLGSVMSTQLRTPGSALGTVNLYADRPAAFGRGDVQLMAVLGRHAALALAAARDEAGLRRAVDTRHTIGLAEGILMERHGLSAEQAFAMLRKRSRDDATRLPTVAADVIATRRLPEHLE